MTPFEQQVAEAMLADEDIGAYDDVVIGFYVERYAPRVAAAIMAAAYEPTSNAQASALAALRGDA